MQLKQFHNSKFVILEAGDTALKITTYRLFKKRIHEISYKDILINDRSDFKHHNKAAFAYTSFFAILFFHFIQDPFFNPRSSWVPTEIIGFFLLLSILSYFITKTKIHILTNTHGLIRLHNNKPSKKKVNDFIYSLEGKIYLLTKNKAVKEKFVYKAD